MKSISDLCEGSIHLFSMSRMYVSDNEEILLLGCFGSDNTQYHLILTMPSNEN